MSHRVVVLNFFWNSLYWPPRFNRLAVSERLLRECVRLSLPHVRITCFPLRWTGQPNKHSTCPYVVTWNASWRPLRNPLTYIYRLFPCKNSENVRIGWQAAEKRHAEFNVLFLDHCIEQDEFEFSLASYNSYTTLSTAGLLLVIYFVNQTHFTIWKAINDCFPVSVLSLMGK